MADEVYARLFAELNAGRYDSAEVGAAIERLGPRALLLRGLARARRHAWASVRRDMLAARSEPIAALTEYIAGTALVVARDYDAGMACLQRAASSAVPAVADYSRKLYTQFARELGWLAESQVMLDAIERALQPGDLDGRTLALRRHSAARGREHEALLGATPDAAAKAWQRMFVDGEAAAARSIHALIERRGEQPELLAVALRIELARGELEQVAARLAALPDDRLLDERAALALACGRPEAVLAGLAVEPDTPRRLLLRGEALLELGQFGAAAATLERARVAMPYSIAIALALALARHHEQPDSPGTELEHRFGDLLAAAPALLADAAGALELALWTDAGPTATRSEMVAILARARTMLTAERDPAASHYRRPGRPLRRVLPARPDHATHLARVHQHDRAWIDKIQSTLVSAIGIDPHGPAGPSIARSSARARPDASGLVERFMADGFVTIPRAFDPELARRWREDAIRRIRDEPERWVRGYDPSDASKQLHAFSPSDPATWTWPRLVLEGNEEVAIDEFAPRAWLLICELLGGPERIKTRRWNNYMNLNCHEGAELDTDRPGPDWPSWHIDDPHPAMRFDHVANGLVCFALFDRVLPASGSTWLCLDSVAEVARELADHPEGVDFVHDRGARITSRCSRFHEVVGEAGDLVLMHPLMMHSGAPNRSGRIRWMGNPMVYMQAPLDPLRRELDELSPVELVMRRAIERA